MTDNSISSTIKKGSRTIQEKISSIFKFKKTFSQPSSTTKQKNSSLEEDKNNTQQEKKKVFNIQLSEEDKENVYEINDEEDEDEEDEIEDQHEDNTNDNNQLHNVINYNKIEDNKQRQTNNANLEVNDINMICHYLYPKGTIVDINDLDIHNFTKLKQTKKGMLSIFGFGNKKQIQEIEVNYLAFFDENYIYFMKDIEYDSNNITHKRIGNRYSLLKLYNAFFDQIDNQRWKISLEFASSSDSNITKVMIFNKESADRFYETLNVYFKIFNMKMSNTETRQEPNSFS